MKSGYSASDYKRLEARMNTYAALAVERLKLLQTAEARVKVLEEALEKIYRMHGNIYLIKTAEDGWQHWSDLAQEHRHIAFSALISSEKS